MMTGTPIESNVWMAYLLTVFLVVTGFAVYDILYRRVPDRALVFFIPLAALAPLIQVYFILEYDRMPIFIWPVVTEALMGALLGFCIPLAAAMATGGSGMGGGDIKFCGVLGLVYGPSGMALVFLVAAGFAMPVVLLYRRLLRNKQPTALPFLPFLACGCSAATLEDVEGLYVTADLAAGDYILTSKVSTVPVSSDVALNDIPSGKVAISLTVKTLASGLSDKLQPGDIIRIYHFLETAEEVPELRFIKVLSVTDSDGINVDNTKEPTEDEEPQQSATITVLASPEQARIITEMENDGVAHVALISRNNDQLAEELLAEQDKTLQEIYFPETLVEENPESQDGAEAAEGAADGESTGEAGTENTEGGVETTPADSIPEDGE